MCSMYYFLGYKIFFCFLAFSPSASKNARERKAKIKAGLCYPSLAVHQPFDTSICISTLPTQHTTFIVFY